MREQREPKVTPNVSIARFKDIVCKIYTRRGLSLPDQLYLSDSAVEEEMRVPGARVYGGSSDIDIIAPESVYEDVHGLENEIRNALGESGVDFNFAPQDDLSEGNAYGRVCRPIKDFEWDK